nr:hypothetical protein [Tanacetum cinerariifolium]
MCNNNFQTKLEYFSEDYNEEREMEPRPEPARAVTLPLREASPRVHRRRERVFRFEETQNKRESIVERNKEGRRPSKEAPRGNGSQNALLNNIGGNLSPNEYFSEDYNKEREMEPRPEPARAVTPPLREASPRVYRRMERVFRFKETQNKGESIVERNNEG